MKTLLRGKRHPEAEKKNSGRRLQDEAYLGFLDMLVFNLPRPGMVKASVLVLGGTRDYIFSPSEVEATEQAYKTQPETFADMPYDMMLEPGWQTVAERILIWLRKWGL